MEKKLNVRKTLVVGALVYVFLWLPLIHFAANVGIQPNIDRLMPEAEYYRPKQKAEIVRIKGAPLTFYYTERAKHTIYYLGVIVQNGREVRPATMAEYAVLENFLRPH